MTTRLAERWFAARVPDVDVGLGVRLLFMLADGSVPRFLLPITMAVLMVMGIRKPLYSVVCDRVVGHPLEHSEQLTAQGLGCTQVSL